MHAERVAGVRNFREDGHEPLTRRHSATRVAAARLWRGSDALRPHKELSSGQASLGNLISADQVIRENPASRGTETSAT